MAKIRVLRTARRRPAWAALVVICCFSLTAGGLGMVRHQMRLREFNLRTQASEQPRLRTSVCERSATAQQALRSHRAGQAVEILTRPQIDSPAGDIREFGWYFLDGMLNRHSAELPRHPADVYGAAFSPDGTHLATSCQDGCVRIWELAATHAHPRAEVPPGRSKAH